MANEYSYEVIYKSAPTIFQELHEASILYFTISTCKCGFSGLSNLNVKNLQNAMGGRMTINSLRIGRSFKCGY
jgi:hypothetical protein